MQWELDAFSKKYLKEITDAAKDSEKIILATDPDREGEAIAWHRVRESRLNPSRFVAGDMRNPDGGRSVSCRISQIYRSLEPGYKSLV